MNKINNKSLEKVINNTRNVTAESLEEIVPLIGRESTVKRSKIIIDYPRLRCRTCKKFFNTFQCGVCVPFKKIHKEQQIPLGRNNVKERLMSRIEAKGGIENVYIKCGHKIIELEEAIYMIKSNFNIEITPRLKGGMIKEKEDITEESSDLSLEDNLNHDLNVPIKPIQIKPQPKIKFNQRARPHQGVPTVDSHINGLRILNPRRTDDLEPQRKNNATYLVRAQIAKHINHQQQNYNEQPKEFRKIGVNGGAYVTSTPIFEGDPAWKLSKTSTPFEDQHQKVRYSLSQNQNLVTSLDPYTGQHVVPQPIPNTFNIMTHWHMDITNIWLPEIMEYNTSFDYACRIINNEIAIAFPYLGTYQIITIPNQLRMTGDSIMLFHEYSYHPGATFFVPEPLEVPLLKGGSVSVPCYLLAFASLWVGGKNMTNFTITSYITECKRWLDKSANSAFELPTMQQMLGALFQAGRKKQVHLFEALGLNFDVLNLQHDNNKLLVELPKHGSLFAILKRIASWIVPQELLDVAKEILDKYRFTGTGYKLWEQLREVFESGVIFLFDTFFGSSFGTPVMKLFNWMNDTLCVVLEEILKCIPGIGLCIAIKELIDDYRNKKLSIRSAFLRLIFHNWQELLPFWAKMLTLPFRILWHMKWNFHSKQNEILLRSEYDRKVSPINEFEIVDHLDSYARFPQSAPIQVPDIVKGTEFVETMLEDTEEDIRNPVCTTANALLPNGAMVKNGNNLINAYLKRNIQEQPLRKLTKEIVYKYEYMAQFWKKKLELEEVDTIKWINSPNHGSKKAMYMRAYKQFQEDGIIEYRGTVSLKLDEILYGTGRTITAFDNSYVVNVAPVIASYSDGLKKLFNGYNDLSRCPGVYTLHILYATGMTSEQIAKVTQDNNYTSTIPHYFLKVLGDDSALLHDQVSLCCDFSRYDSTQHPEHHEAFRTMLLTSWNEDQVNMLRKAANANSQMFHPKTHAKYTIPTRGLKTGCVETSVSNTTVTALSYAIALEHAILHKEDPFLSIPIFLKEKCGFLPKASIQHITTGEEFLKTIFIMQNGNIVTMPLLSSLAKIGKFLHEPRLMVPMSKLKSKSQIAVDATYMQLVGKGDMDTLPGYNLWYTKLKSMSQPFLSGIKNDWSVVIRNKDPVTEDTMDIAYETRYGLSYHEVLPLFEGLASANLEDYPFNYSSTVLQRAVEVDYQVENMWF